MAGLELPALGQVHQLGSMHQITKNRFPRLLLGSISFLVCLFLIFSWWVQTTVKIGDLGKKFDAEKIIREVEIQSGGYSVRGLKGLFEANQNQKIWTISLNQTRTIQGEVHDTKYLDSVAVNVWKGTDPKNPIMYRCRLSDTGDLIISRIYLEGTQ